MLMYIDNFVALYCSKPWPASSTKNIRVLLVHALQYSIGNLHFIISDVDQSASSLTKTGYHTLPAGLNDNNNGILLSSSQTVVALTHVMVNPPSRSSESARVCVAVVESKSRQK